MLLVTQVDVAEILPEVEWPTLVFFMGLFAMVAGLVHTGVIGSLGDLAVATFGDNFFAAATGLLFGYARRLHRQHPLHRHDDAGRRRDGGLRADAETAARCGGPCLRRLLQRQRHGDRGERQRRRHRHRRAAPRDQLRRFTRYGIVVTLLSTVLAWIYVWLRYF